MSNSEYWARRFKELEDTISDHTYEFVENLEKQFDYAVRDIETQMRAWYQRFADNNKISLAEAKRLLKSDELKEFKWTVQEYIEKGKEMNLSGAWLKELENASARVHISRLDSLKLQLRQYAEMLTQKQIEAVTDAAEFSYTESYYHTAFEFQKGIGVGWTMQGINQNLLNKVLSQPWTVDGMSFTARCWTNKDKLVEILNREITRMAATGAAPDKAIEIIAKQFNTSKRNAGRVVMTESAAFSSAARKDCFNELDVEMFEFVAALDHHTCDLCGEMDGKVFKMSEYQVGVTAEPLHPCCRCTTAPCFEDMAGLGERYARDIETGEAYKVPSNMTYKQWRALQGQKPLEKSAKSGIIKSLDIDDFNVMASTHELLPEVTKVIGDTISQYEKKGGMFISDVHFGDFYDEATGKPALFQVTLGPYGMTELNVNSRFLGGKSLKEINLAISTTEANLPVDLREAVIHECGHAKAYYRKSASDIYAMNSELCNQGVPGISDIAAFDGAECIAEVEVLLSRGDSVPDEAMDLYNKFVKGVQK